MTRREAAIGQNCPTCGAAVGEACIGRRGARKAPHRARFKGITGMFTKRSEGDRVTEFIRECAAHEALRFEEECESVIRRCESPIESLLLVALVAASKIEPFTQLIFCNGEMPERPDFDEAAFFYPQTKIGPYRVDLAIWDASVPFELKNPRIMIVECDGHDFHEKTKDQARRDKQRDRFLQSRGYKVLRFTGSEIWADPGACADEIIGELARDDDWRNREKK